MRGQYHRTFRPSWRWKRMLTAFLTSTLVLFMMTLPVLGERFSSNIITFTGATTSSYPTSVHALYHRFTWIPASTVSACTSITADISSDGAVWTNVTGPVSCASAGIATSVSTPARYYRLTIVGLTGGNLLVGYSGYDTNPAGGVTTVTVGNTVTAQITGTPTVTGTVQVNGGTITATPTGTQAVSGTVNVGGGTLTGVTGTVQANAGTGTQNVTFTNTAIQSNQGTAANVTAGWPQIGGYITTSTALTSASPLDTTMGLNVQGYGVVTVQHVPAGTMANGIINFEGRTSTASSTWQTIMGVRQDNATAFMQNSFNASGAAILYSIPVAGLSDFRVRLNPQITNTGTDSIYLAAGNARDPWVAISQINGVISDNIAQYGAVAVSTANPFIDGGRASTDTTASVADGAVKALRLSKFGEPIIAIAPPDLQSSARAALTATTASQILASSGGAGYRWAITFLSACNLSPTVAGQVDITDSSGTLYSFPWTQTSSAPGEPRCIVINIGDGDPIYSVANTTISAKATIANGTGFTVNVAAHKTGT